jgi:hypothetical protein
VVGLLLAVVALPIAVLAGLQLLVAMSPSDPCVLGQPCGPGQGYFLIRGIVGLGTAGALTAVAWLPRQLSFAVRAVVIAALAAAWWPLVTYLYGSAE